MHCSRREFAAGTIGLLCAGALRHVTQPFAFAAEEAGTAADTWPLPRGDAQSTGVVQGTLPADMKLAWKFDVKEGAFIAPAIIAEGTVFVGDADGTFYAFNLADGAVKWKDPRDTSYSGGAAYRDGKVFVGDLDGRVRCYDAKKGDIVWQYNTGGEEEYGGEISASPNFYKDILLVGSRDSTLYAINIPDGKPAWQYQIGDQIRCAPTVVGNRTFLAGCDAKLHIVDVDKGTAVNTVDIKSQTGSSPAAMGDRVYLGSGKGLVFCVDWKTAKIEWIHADERSEQQIESSAAVTPEAIYYGSQDKRLHALDPKSGDKIWTFQTRGAVDSSPIVVGDRVYFGSVDGRVYGVNRKTGKEAWKYEAGGRFRAGPAVASGRLVIGNENGTLYCFGDKQ
jgi:outer membrane protein assembly factor BamB